MTITEIVESSLSTALLEAMFRTNEAMIRNLKAYGIEPKQLIGWRNQLSAAISIRKAIEYKPMCEITEKQDRDFDLRRRYGE